MSRFVVLLSAITVVAGGWIAAWFTLATVITDKANQFMQASLSTSRPVQCEKLSVGGFPLSFDVTCTKLLARAGDITLSLPQIKASVLIYRPTRMRVSVTAPAQISDAFSGSRRQVRWDNLRALFVTNGWALDHLSIAADNLELVDNLVGEKPVARVRLFAADLIDNPQKYNKPKALVQLNAFVRADEITLGELDLANANLRLKANIDAIPDDLRKWSLATIARNWFRRKTGIDLVSFTGADGISEFKLSGQLSATGQGRLSGDFALHTQNVTERLQPLFDPTTLQILFGFPGNGASRDQFYSLRHGVLLAGNLPILTVGALK